MSDRTKGILSILASAFGFALMAALIRLCDDYGSSISTFQKSFFRNFFSGFSTLASVPFVCCHYVPMTAAQRT